ncbi:MAG: gephyrin-like molybdotransferase Glp [Pseudomonadota bacterium]
MAQHKQALDLEEALQTLQNQFAPSAKTEQVSLDRSHGRVVALDISAPVDLPPFHASAMDGYAILTRSPDGEYQLIAESFAGHPYLGGISPGQAVRVYTGALVPPAAERVVIQEQATPLASDRVALHFESGEERFIRPPGHDVRAGTQIARRGQRVDAFLHGALAASGVNELAVYSPLRVGVFSSGDELVDPSVAAADLQPGQIYDSNRVTVMRLLEDLPAEIIDLGRLPDEAQAVRTALAEGSRSCDALVTSGGVSVGDADFITSTIQALGELSFWKLNLKPGKPLAVGRIDDCILFGLPGNPVSAIVTLLLVAKPMLRFLGGAAVHTPIPIPASLRTPLTHRPGRAEYQRGTFGADREGLWVAHTGDQSSNRLQSFTQANCLIEIPKDSGDLPAGQVVNILPMHGLLTD